MSEQDPLLPTHNGADANTNADTSPPSEGRFAAYRERTAYALESRTLHKTVIALTAIDAICIIIDLGYTVLSDSCTPAEGPGAPEWLETLSLISLIITTFFLLEIPLTLWAFGTDFYHPFSSVPHASLHLFDALIIITTFTLEFFLKGKERELAGLLILFRLWRIVKLVGGIAVGAGEIQEETVKELLVTQRKLKETQTALSNALKENEDLKKQVSGTASQSPS